MNSDDLLDALLADLAPLSDEEKAVRLLSYFSALVETMDAPTLREFRAHCVVTFGAGKEQEAILEQIDGQLALYALGI